MSERKSGGCRSFLVTAVILFFAWLFINNFISELNKPQTAPTNTPPTTITVPVKPQIPEEDNTKPLPPVVKEVDIAKVVQEAPSSNETITRHYDWQYGDSEWSWDVSIPGALYDYYKGIPRPPTRNYSVYVTHPLDDPYITHLVEKIKEAATKQGYDEYQTIELAIVFVQSLPYTVDSVTTPFDEYPRYPIETLVDGGGDCEDTAILLAAVINQMGYGVVLLGLPDHMAVGIKGGDDVYGTYWEYRGYKYYYLETTETGWGIGQLPDEYTGMSANIFAMVPVPIITHNWDLETDGYFARIKVTVDNLGSATASGVYVLVGFDAGDNKIWNPAQSDPINLAPGMQATITLTLRPPPSGIHTRLVVQIVMGDESVDNSYSAWVDT